MNSLKKARDTITFAALFTLTVKATGCCPYPEAADHCARVRIARQDASRTASQEKNGIRPRTLPQAVAWTQPDDAWCLDQRVQQRNSSNASIQLVPLKRSAVVPFPAWLPDCRPYSTFMKKTERLTSVAGS